VQGHRLNRQAFELALQFEPEMLLRVRHGEGLLRARIFVVLADPEQQINAGSGYATKPVASVPAPAAG
jgi:hypothetical protein